MTEICNTKLRRRVIQISEYGAPILYHPGKLNVCADMLFMISFVQPAVQFIPPVPDVFETDSIGPKDLQEDQTNEYKQNFIETSKETDETVYGWKWLVIYICNTNT